MATLRECIDRWHAAHPDFSPLTPASSSVGTHGDVVAVDTLLPCAQNLIEAAPAPARRRTTTSRMRQAASRLGISYRAYQSRVIRGQRWCSGHQAWHDANAFRARRDGYDRNTSCQAWHRIEQETYATRRERKAS